MREGPLETLDRHRNTFTKSLIDGIGKFDAGADFYFAAISAERNGYILSKSDEALLNMFNSVIKKEDDAPVTSSNFVDLEREAEQGQLMAQGTSEQGMGTALAQTGGINLSDNPSYDEERVIPPMPGQSLAGRQMRMSEGEASDPYAFHNFLGSDMNPLHGEMHNIVGNFYHDEDGFSQSEKDAEKESRWESHVGDELNPAKFLLNDSFYQKLDTEHGTNHALYLHDYNSWKINNAKDVDNITRHLEEQGADEEQIERELKNIHINQKKQEWKRNLGLMDYLFGLEWLTPQERNDFYQHLQTKGIKEAFKTNRFPNNPNFIPRTIRNFHQRFSPLYDMWIRHPDRPGHGIETMPIGLSEEASYVSPELNYQALLEHQPPGKDERAWERSISHFNRMIEDMNTVTGDNKRNILPSEVPYVNKDGSIDYVPLEKRVTVGKDAKGLKAEGTQKYFPGYESLKLLLGIDENHNLYPQGQHPIWGELWDGGEFSQDEVDEIMKKRQLSAITNVNSGRVARAHSPIHYGFAMNPDSYDYLDDNETASTYWHLPFVGKGGLAKNPNELYNLLHHHSLLYRKKEQAKKEPSFDVSGYYGQDFIPEEEEEQEDLEYEPHIENNQEHSLLFTRTPNNISVRSKLGDIRGDYEQYGELLDIGMLPYLAPFGQKESQLFSQRSKGKEVRAAVSASDPMLRDSASLLNPHNVHMSSRIKGLKGQNAQFARHASTVDSADNNEMYKLYHNARSTGEFSDLHHKILQGEGFGNLRVAHPFVGKGSSGDDESMEAQSAHSYHNIGTMLGFAQPPMNPQRDVLNINAGNINPTLAYHKEDFLPLRSTKQGVSQTDEENELKQLDEQFERDMAIAPSDDVKDLLEEEYQRRRARIQQRFKRTWHTPSESLAGGGFADKLNPSGEVTPVLSTQPLSGTTEYGEITNEYEEAIAQLTMLEESKEIREEIGDERGANAIHSQIQELNNKISELESQLETGTMTGQRFSPDGHDSTLENRLVADTNAITAAAKQLKEMIRTSDPELHDFIFNPNADHETAEANMRMFAKMANDYLNTVPHEQHGIHTQAMQNYTEEGLSGQVDDGIQVKHALQQHPHHANLQSGDIDGFMTQLGLDPNEHYARKTVTDYLENILVPELQQDPSFSAPVMTMRQIIQQRYPDMDIDKAHESLKKDQRVRDTNFLKIVNALYNNIGHKSSDERNDKIGIHHFLAYNADPRPSKKREKPEQDLLPSAGGKGMAKYENDYWNVKQKLDSLITDIPSITPPKVVTERKRGIRPVPVDQFGTDSHSVHSLYNSTGFAHEFGGWWHPTFRYKMSRKGDVQIIPVPEGHPQLLVQPLGKFWEAVAPEEWMTMLRHPDHQSQRDRLNTQEKMGAQFKTDEYMSSRNMDARSVHKSDVGLADLTNPDIIRKEIGNKVPILQPMHRIFELSDLEELRGFTGDWIVSHMPEGERGFVKKEDDKITCDSFTLSDEDKENFKKVTDKDYQVDVIKLDDGYYIFDVIKFGDKEVHSEPLNDRIKVLRGGMEGIENIHTPSASDTRLTDDAGLKSIVDDLSKTYDGLLLRDAKSVYMVGELRHPKWVMLKPGQDVVLRVLERRGSSPYTYRLGTGPITQEDKIGDRAVESDGEIYMDVGVAFNSPEKFNEGDHVRVSAANVSKVEGVDNNNIYTLTGSKIIGEAEGEGLVSRETLDLLAKAEDTQWLCEVQSAKSGIRINMPQGDVVYKCTQSGHQWMVHSPLAKSNYLIRLAESQRQYWSPVAGAMLKAGVEIAEKEEVHESKGDGKPLIQPDKEENTDWWKRKEKQKVLVKGLVLLDKFMKSTAGSVGVSNAGAKGLAIDYATPLESPTGATNLHDEKTMPDFDNRKRPGEDSDIEPNTDEEKPPKSITVPMEEGVLEVTSDKATFHT